MSISVFIYYRYIIKEEHWYSHFFIPEKWTIFIYRVQVNGIVIKYLIGHGIYIIVVFDKLVLNKLFLDADISFCVWCEDDTKMRTITYVRTIYFNIVFNKANVFYYMQTWHNIIEWYMQLYYFSSVRFLNHIHLHPVDFTNICKHSSKLFFSSISKSEPPNISFGVKYLKYNYVLSIFRVYICHIVHYIFHKIIINDILFHFHYKHRIFYQLDFYYNYI